MEMVRTPLVLFGYLIARARRLPIVSSVLDHSLLIAGGLLAAAVVAFAVWAGTIAPQRVSLGDLVAGQLSTMQTWIIISGDLAEGASGGVAQRYVLTDPTVPNAKMNVISEVALPIGQTTISGTYVGGNEAVPVGYQWIGTMRADPELAPELGPPWGAIFFVGCAALLLVAARVSYPVFVGQRPRLVALSSGELAVGVRRGSSATDEPAVPAAIELRPGAPVELRLSDADRQPLRLHSVHTGVDVGELRRIEGAEPALRIWRPTDVLTLSFASTSARDAVYAAMVADEDRSALLAQA